MQRILLILMLVLFMALLVCASHYKVFMLGKEAAYEEIILEECWLDKQTRDIECTHYVGK